MSVAPLRRRWGSLPWVVAVADIAVFTLAMAVSGETELQFFAILGAIIASSVLVGALLMTRATGNNVGPLLLIAGTTQTANLVVGEYVAHLEGPGGPIALVGNGLNQVVLTWALLAILTPACRSSSRTGISRPVDGGSWYG